MCHNLINLDDYILNCRYDAIFIHGSKNLDYFNRINLAETLILISNDFDYSSDFVNYRVAYNDVLISRGEEYSFEDFIN